MSPEVSAQRNTHAVMAAQEKDSVLLPLWLSLRFMLWRGLAVAIWLIPTASAVAAINWETDAQILVKAITQIHPQPYTPPCAASIATLEHNLSDDRTSNLLLMAAFTASLGDGHTAIHLARPGETGFLQYPVRIYKFDDGFFIRAIGRSYQQFIGAKIIKINDVPVATAFRRVALVTSHDNAMTLAAIVPAYFSVPEVLSGLGIAKDAKQLDLSVETPSGSQATLHLKAVPGGSLPGLDTDAAPIGMPFDASALLSSGIDHLENTPRWLLHPQMPFWMDYDAKNGAIYAQINRIYNSDSETLADFAKDIVNEFARRRADRLILDLRLNGGGDGSLNRSFLNTIVADTALNRPGHFFVLIGRHTFSAAEQLVTKIKVEANAIFIGEPTGGRESHWGDTVPIKLPNSGVVVRIATKYWQAPEGLASVWTAPDIPGQLSSEDYAAGRDPSYDIAVKATANSPLAMQLEGASKAASTPKAVLDLFHAQHGAQPYVDVSATLESIGYDLYRKKDYGSAEEVFQVLNDAYVSADAQVDLGDVELVRADKDAARAHFLSALALDTRNLRARRRLRNMDDSGAFVISDKDPQCQDVEFP